MSKIGLLRISEIDSENSKPYYSDNPDIQIIRIRGSEFGSDLDPCLERKKTSMYLMNFNTSYFLNKN